jgi:transcriptional regulator with XRE-family HTH domain
MCGVPIVRFVGQEVGFAGSLGGGELGFGDPVEGVVFMSEGPRVSAGLELRALREAAGMGLREVERYSRQFAERLGNEAYLVSHNYLAEIEADRHKPSLFKLYTLSVVYNADLLKLLCLYGMGGEDILRAELGSEQPASGSGGQGALGGQEIVRAAETSITGVERTRLLPGGATIWDATLGALLPRIASDIALYGVIGMKDLTMDPLLPPGSIIQIDTERRSVEAAVWRNEFERPIYFLRAQQEYACGWCQVERETLSLIPHPLSPARMRQFRYPGEVEVVGRVTAVTMSLLRTAGGLVDSRSE